jgi:hypothetical protein
MSNIALLIVGNYVESDERKSGHLKWRYRIFSVGMAGRHWYWRRVVK